jgi:multidrug resistance efflux pump
MSDRNLVPIPAGQKWRLFRENHIPWMVFCLALAAAFFIWTRFVFPSPLVGKVEATEVNVGCPKAGVLTQLRVSRFQPVSAGDILGEVTVSDPAILSASIGVIKAEIELIRTSLSPVQVAQRSAINFDQMEMDLLKEKVNLATEKVNLQLAENEFHRVSKLFEEKIVADSQYDAAKLARDARAAQVAELNRLVEISSKSLEKLRAVKDSAMDSQTQVRAAIAVEEEKLKLAEAELRPFILRAPISGIINMLPARMGEAVTAGATIMTVSLTNSAHIVGYLRQPIYREPAVGMEVEVRARKLNQQKSLGKILSVGAQMQSINDALLPPTKLDVSERGLPILVSLPKDFRAHPGEFVDLRILWQPTTSK